jgi:predicted metal-binding membrane protein
VVFAGGAAFAQLALQAQAWARAVPVATAAVVLLAGAFQFTAWKARHLACCRPASARGLAPAANAAAAWQYGVWLGLQCSRACAGLTAILLVIGVMDLRAMALVAAAVTAERLAPAGERVAWAIGAVSLVSGLYLMVRAAWWP